VVVDARHGHSRGVLGGRREHRQAHPDLERIVRKHFDLTPRGIDETHDLRRPIYRVTSYHGHFGRENVGLPWERTDKAEAIRADL